jgi:ubiquinone/menaquinone biosynthesis C-methylase UbiE
MSAIFTDSTILRTAAYDADDDLRARRETHERYSERRDDFHDWVMGLLPRQPQDALLDVGTGPGDFPRLLRERGHAGAVCGLDLSEGMVRTARSAAPTLQWLVADVQALPFGAGGWDGAMARHMLYHVPDISGAVAEMARVLRPGGWAVATTNSVDSLALLFEVWKEVRHPLVVAEEKATDRFPLEGAARFFEPYFERVTTHVREDALLFPSPEPVKHYVASSRALRLAPGHTEADWDEAKEQLFAAVERLWEREAEAGVLRVPKRSGLVLAEGKQ